MAYKVTVKTTLTLEDEQGETNNTVPEYSWETQLTSKTGLVSWQRVINNSEDIVWNPTVDGGEAVSDFDLLFIVSDKTVELELTINEGDANEELISLTLAPNIPLVLGSDAARFNHSASDAFGGTLDVIDKIRVKEGNTTDATVKAWLVT
jgi:hypothetical protein